MAFLKKPLAFTLSFLALSLVAAAVVFTVGVLLPLEVPVPQLRPARLLISNGQVVDVVSGLLLPGADILVDNGEIVAVGVDLAAAGAHILDAQGRYVIPGLFDMHVHSYKLAPALMHPLFVAAGVTAVRDMGGCIGAPDPWVACATDKRQWNSAVARGKLLAPRYDQVTSLAIDGGNEIPAALDRGLGAGTAAGARARVAHDKQRGIDFLKPYSMLPREGYFALASAVQQDGLYLAGHVPLAVTALEAIAAGQRSIEHAFLFIWDCYPAMDELRGQTDIRAVYTSELRKRMIEEHDKSACANLHREMVAAGTGFVPTHTTRKLDAYATDEQFRGDPRLQYVPAPLRVFWLEDADAMAERAGAGGQASYRAIYEFGLLQTGIAHRAGVTIMAGTDAPDSFVFPGTGLHDELEHLTAAGLSPLDALRSATVAPAGFLGLAGQAGVIRPGARADLVLLEDNPLENISAVRSIHAVVLAGTPYKRPVLDDLLAGVADSAGHWSVWPKFIWQTLTSPIMRRQFAD